MTDTPARVRECRNIRSSLREAMRVLDERDALRKQNSELHKSGLHWMKVAHDLEREIERLRKRNAHLDYELRDHEKAMERAKGASGE